MAAYNPLSYFSFGFLRPNICHVETTRSAFGMKRIITFLQEGHFIKEKPHMALTQFIFRRLAF